MGLVPEEFVEGVLSRGEWLDGPDAEDGAFVAFEAVGLEVSIVVDGDDGDLDGGDDLGEAVEEVDFEAEHEVAAGWVEGDEEYLVASHVFFGGLYLLECVLVDLLEGVVAESECDAVGLAGEELLTQVEGVDVVLESLLLCLTGVEEGVATEFEGGLTLDGGEGAPLSEAL